MRIDLPLLTIAATLAFGSVVARAESPAGGAGGLVSYWSFDDNTADGAWLFSDDCGTAEDNLRPVGGPPEYVPGKVGRAIRLSRLHLKAPFSADVRLAPSYTIEAWIKPDELANPWQRLVLNWGSEKGYHFAIHDKQVSLYHKQSDGQEPHPEGGTVQQGKWQHVAAVADAKSKRLTVYLDGKPVAAVDYDGTIHRTTHEGLGVGDSAVLPHEKGAPGEGYKFAGCIDELAVWNVALAGDRIRSHYENPQRRFSLRARTFRQVIADDQPEAYWQLDETTGAAIQDASGNAHHGTCRGGVALGKPGIPASIAANRAVSLDGKDDCLDAGDIDQLDGLTAISVEAWIRWTGPPGGFHQEADFIGKQGIFALGGGFSANRDAASPGPVFRNWARFRICDDSAAWHDSDNGTTDLDDGRWHHVAGVYDGQFVRVYVDGIEESSRKIGPVTLHANDRPVVIGSGDGRSKFFTGRIDEAAVYTRALSPTEIYEHYVFGSDP